MEDWNAIVEEGADGKVVGKYDVLIGNEKETALLNFVHNTI